MGWGELNVLRGQNIAPKAVPPEETATSTKLPEILTVDQKEIGALLELNWTTEEGSGEVGLLRPHHIILSLTSWKMTQEQGQQKTRDRDEGATLGEVRQLA